MDEQLRQDRFHAAGGQMLGVSGRQIMPERVKAHGGGEGADEKTDKKSKKKDEDENEDDEFFLAEAVEDEPAKPAKGKTEDAKGKSRKRKNKGKHSSPPWKAWKRAHSHCNNGKGIRPGTTAHYNGGKRTRHA